MRKFATLLLAAVLAFMLPQGADAQVDIHPIVSATTIETGSDFNFGYGAGVEASYTAGSVVFAVVGVIYDPEGEDNATKRLSTSFGFELIDHLMVLGHAGVRLDQDEEGGFGEEGERNVYGVGLRWHRATLIEAMGDAWIEGRYNSDGTFELRFSP